MSKIKGCITALITPFDSDGKIDESAFESLILRQIKNGVHGLVPCGTTGESPTLSHEEHQEVIRIAIDVTKNKDNNSPDSAIWTFLPIDELKKCILTKKVHRCHQMAELHHLMM